VNNPSIWELKLHNGQQDFLAYVLTVLEPSESILSGFIQQTNNPLCILGCVSSEDVWFDHFNMRKRRKGLELYRPLQFYMMLHTLLEKIKNYSLS
jgi:hypothetical protein